MTFGLNEVLFWVQWREDRSRKIRRRVETRPPTALAKSSLMRYVSYQGRLPRLFSVSHIICQIRLGSLKRASFDNNFQKCQQVVYDPKYVCLVNKTENFKFISIARWILTEFWENFGWILAEFWLNFDWILAEFWLNFDWILTEFWLNFGWFWLNCNCTLT